ncbi:MAG: NAD(P)/FAD-dependent oxidoreductase [Candidatus Thorarchaeota archaeon]|nr:NAD(P)/FAD-dependent oxidoreductase [Candidatus Thorarchaeota archaeon]
MSDYDVIVVGGGPGGSTAARRTAQRGHTVLLLDKEKFPRVKPCAGGVHPTGIAALDFGIDEVVQRRPYGFRMYAPSGMVVDCTQQEPSGGLVMRTDFDHLLLKKAEEAGADVREGEKVVGAEQDSKGVSVITTEGEIYTGSYLVGADGINSVVAKSLGFYTGWPKDTAAVTIEVEAEVGKKAVERICGVPEKKDSVAFHIYLGAVEFGYAWCFPKKSILSVGLGGRQDRVQNLRSTFDAWFEEFKHEHELEPEILSDTAARVPYSGAAPKTILGRTLLVGDAAGFVNPFDQGGIFLAIRSGVIAAQIMNEAAKTENADGLKRYEKACHDDFGDVLKIGKKIAKLLFKSKKNMETVSRLGTEDPVIRDIMFRLVDGQDSYTKLYRALVKRFLFKHPRAGLSLYT